MPLYPGAPALTLGWSEIRYSAYSYGQPNFSLGIRGRHQQPRRLSRNRGAEPTRFRNAVQTMSIRQAACQLVVSSGVVGRALTRYLAQKRARSSFCPLLGRL